MKKFLTITIFLGLLAFSESVTYYEYYAPGGVISSGLEAEGDSFSLNGKAIQIYSGALHYFRVHPDHWRDTLKKLRAAGLNTVETYMPWNLHNPEQNLFDFGAGPSDMSAFLDVRGFIQIAQEEDLFVILRPGPYICSEWEFGGMPSWLLSDYTMSLRSSYAGYTSAVGMYYAAFAPLVSDLSFVKGGPIIAVQIENEFGHFGYDDQPRDKRYLSFLQDTLLSNGIDDVLLFTSDTPADTLDWGSLSGVLMTANFQTGVEENLDTLKMLQPNRPMMVMEYWTGWFDHWLSEIHITRDPELINTNLEAILTRNASVNFYMFIGGTNFGFMAGANKVDVWPHYAPIVTSYDYDAPLTEEGDYGEKYALIKATLLSHNALAGIVDDPAPPPERVKAAYGNFPVQESLDFQSLINQVPVTGQVSDGPIPMEEFSFLNNGNGQSYGYALYTTSVDLPAGNSTILIRGHVRDMAQVLVDGTVVTKPYANQFNLNNFGFWNGLDQSLDFETAGGTVEISILVENLGRVNYGFPHFYVQKKGLWEGPIYIGGNEIKDWTIVPFEFKKSYVTSLTGWEPFTSTYATPAAYRANVTIEGVPQDTFLNMKTWNKGVVFVNGFNLGRYWSEGPTKTLYIPAPLLISGENEFVVFEQYEAAAELVFEDEPTLGLLNK